MSLKEMGVSKDVAEDDGVYAEEVDAEDGVEDESAQEDSEDEE